MIRVWVVQFWVTVRYLREPWSALLLGLADVTLRSGCSCPSSTWQENLEKISVMATLNMVKVCGLFACSLGKGDCNRLVLVSSCIQWFGY